jgi:uncharacterized protein YcaQ
MIEQARNIQESEAREKLILIYLASVGAARITDLRKLFRWDNPQLINTLNSLERSSQITGGLKAAEQTGEWIAVPEVF